MATFRANGEDLEIPDVGTLTLDESIVVYNYSGLTLDQLGELDGLHPGVLAALVHVAVARANLDQKPKDIEKAVRALNLADLVQSVQDPDQQDEPLDLGSSRSSDSNTGASGSTSSQSSETSPAPSPLRAIGTDESDTSESSPDQARTELVV